MGNFIKVGSILKKVIILVAMATVLITAFTACNSNGAEKTLRNFLTAFYSVNQSDYDYYEKMIGRKPSEPAEADELYKTNTQKFEKYLTDKSYQPFLNERLSYLGIANAYKGNYFVEVKNIKLGKISEDKESKTICYHYDIELNGVDKDTKKAEPINKNGTLTVVNENGNWKIVDKIR